MLRPPLRENTGVVLVSEFISSMTSLFQITRLNGSMPG